MVNSRGRQREEEPANHSRDARLPLIYVESVEIRLVVCGILDDEKEIVAGNLDCGMRVLSACLDVLDMNYGLRGERVVLVGGELQEHNVDREPSRIVFVWRAEHNR